MVPLPLNQVLCGDCREVMARFPEDSIDLVVTSPPYWGFIYLSMVVSYMDKRDDKGRFIKGCHYNPDTEFKKGEHWREPKPYWNREWLYNEYIVKGRSASEIANDFECNENNILYFIHKYDISTRSVSEAREIKYWGSIGEDNPMFNKKGELNPNWKGGITPPRQALYSTLEWKALVKKVRKRDENTCQRCGEKEEPGNALIIHHISPFKSENYQLALDNLTSLCHDCHIFVHSDRNKGGEFVEKLDK